MPFERKNSKTAGAENTPTQTYCPVIPDICMGCYEKQSKRNPMHQCGGKLCFNPRSYPSYYLMELLSSGAFKLDRQGKGYVQTTQSITIPECPVCYEEYSLRDVKSEPLSLYCGHTVCNGCFTQRARLRPHHIFKHIYKCPLCQANSYYSKTSWENRLKTFLRELDEKSRQKEAEMKSICEDCRKEVSLLEMFQCMDCGDKVLCPRCSCKNHRLHQIIDLEVVEVSLLEMFQCMDCGDKMLCCRCAWRNHHPHQVIDLEVAEVKKLGKVTRETIIPQIEAYNVCFPELQSDLIKNFNECQKKILSRTDQLGYLNGFAKAKEQQEACIAFGERFETICEKYLGESRSFNTGIEKLIDVINESPK